MDNFADMDKKTRRKMTKMVKNASYAVGGGAGLFFVKYLFPEMDGMEKAQKLFSALGLYLVCYGLIVFLTFLFKRDWVFKINSILIWLVTPVVVLKLIMQAW